MFFFSNSEKSEIERQYLTCIGNLPNQLAQKQNYPGCGRIKNTSTAKI